MREPSRRLIFLISLASALTTPINVVAASTTVREYVRAAPTAIDDGPSLLFVHGWKAEADPETEFNELIAPLANANPDRVSYFEYYQDAVRKGATTCDGVQTEPSPDPGSSMPPPSRPGTNYCDSQSDLAYNVVLLRERVEALYTASDDHPVVLVGNSLGAAIIRGLLSYSSDLDDGVASTKIDSVIFLEGAVDGSNVARVATTIGSVICLLRRSECALVQVPTTPAVIDFAAESDWYQWANPGEERLPDIPIFNVFGDIRPQACFLWADNCAPVGESVGDGLLPPGTNDPFDVPDGGASFLRGEPAAQNWQWPVGKSVMTGGVPEGIFPFPVAPFTLAASLPLHPAFHGNFEFNMDVLTVTDCADWDEPVQISLLDQIVRIITGRLKGEPYNCEPEPHT
jgi:pimeloyl-ACP methyl ester carboxylesterase